MDTSLFFGGSVVAAMVAGSVSLFAPCCISVMMPAYLASAFQNRRLLVAMTFLFAAGIATVILPIALGVVALQAGLPFYSNLLVFIVDGTERRNLMNSNARTLKRIRMVGIGVVAAGALAVPVALAAAGGTADAGSMHGSAEAGSQMMQPSEMRRMMNTPAARSMMNLTSMREMLSGADMTSMMDGAEMPMMSSDG